MEKAFLPVYNFPAARFAYENSPPVQLVHVLSEINEVLEAFAAADSYLDDHLLEELVDLTHSLESFWRTLELIVGREAVQALFLRIAEKNRLRGYYETGDRLDPWGDR
jgi:hypothetical protein